VSRQAILSEFSAYNTRLRFRLQDWLRSSTGDSEFNCDVYGNFLLRHGRTGELSSTHGVRSLHDVALGADIRESPDLHHPLGDKNSSRRLARALLDGSALRHLAGIFATSDNHIVGLVEVVLCVDSYTRQPWLQGLEPARIYERAAL